MKTRYARRRVFLMHSSCEEPEEVLVLGAHRDCGINYYRVKVVDGGAIVDIPVRDVSAILHRKSKVVKIKTRLKLVK
jgi:hypothetical protein